MLRLVEALRRAPPLRRFRMARCGLDDLQLARLGAALADCVSELDVSSNSLQGAGGFAGLAAAGGGSHIVSLDVAGNALSHAGAVAVAEAAEALGLLELVIGGAAGVYYMSAGTVAACLGRAQASFERLAVESAVLDVRASAAVRDAVIPGASLRLHDCTLAQAGMQLPRMRELSLSRSGAAAAMTSLVRQCLIAGGLEHLAVRRGGVGWSTIDWNDADCSQLQTLAIERAPLWDSDADLQPPAPLGESRSAARRDWQSEEVLTLAGRALPTLACCSHDGGHWASPFRTATARPASASTCLLELPPRLEALRLWDVHLDAPRLGGVLRSLEHRSLRRGGAPLRRLCLGGNDSIGMGGWKELASWLGNGKAVRFLEELALNACGLDDVAGASLVLALVQQACRSGNAARPGKGLRLRRLDLGSNSFGDAALTAASLLLIERGQGAPVSRLQHLRLHAPTAATRMGIAALLAGLLSSTSCRSCQAWTAALSRSLPDHLAAFGDAIRAGERIRRTRARFALWAIASKFRG